MYDRANFDYNEPHPPDVGSYEEVACAVCEGLGIIPWGWLRDEKEDTMPGEEA